tara:strand:+ start:514 stop:771 length:258 start_codon:yes stop_codon:yes gene_type:complete
MEDIKFKLIPPFVKGMMATYMLTVITVLLFITCEDVRIGKTKQELSKEMFEIDSLIKTIQLQIDSTSIEFDEFYINAQRINNGSN